MRPRAVAPRPARSAALPASWRAQLALLVTAPPAGDAWLHELKFDGYRIGCRMDGPAIRLISRNGNDWTSKFPEVRAAVADLPVRRAFLDGEVAAFLPDGRTSFQALQQAFKSAVRPALAYCVFDLLHLDGEDLSRLPLEERKQRLQTLLARQRATSRIRYSDHVIGNGAKFFEHACRQGLEGIISKRRTAPYEPGRGGSWVKTKCITRQEFVIGGFTEPEGSRAGIGALLVGVHEEKGALRFAGKVGTGFTRTSALELRQRLEPLAQPKSPFVNTPTRGLGRHVHWVTPTLVAEVAFTEWTADGKIRHPSFQGLREDKRGAEVIHERPAAITEKSAPATHRVLRATAPAQVAGVRITHPDRVLWPAIRFTKLGLAQFYEEIAAWILPHLAGRPLTLVRCPRGVGAPCFYMKHSPAWAPSDLRRVRLQEKKKVGEYLIADSLPALIALVQMDVLEIHTWNTKTAGGMHADRVVFDLDPGPSVRWARVIDTARLVRDALQTLGLTSFVKTTGGAGLHVVAPLAPPVEWSAALTFARALANALARHNPALYTTTFAKAGRERKILIDYLRNNHTNTAVAAYSTRAKPDAPVSVPLAWDELDVRVRSDHYTVRNLVKRLAGLRADPWKAYGTCRQRLTPDALEAVARL